MTCDYISVDVEPSAIGAVLVTKSPLADEGLQFLQTMQQMTATPLASYPAKWSGRCLSTSTRADGAHRPGARCAWSRVAAPALCRSNGRLPWLRQRLLPS